MRRGLENAAANCGVVVATPTTLKSIMLSYLELLQQIKVCVPYNTSIISQYVCLHCIYHTLLIRYITHYYCTTYVVYIIIHMIHCFFYTTPLIRYTILYYIYYTLLLHHLYQEAHAVGMSSKVTELTKQSEELAKILALFRNGVCLHIYAHTFTYYTHVVYLLYHICVMYDRYNCSTK